MKETCSVEDENYSLLKMKSHKVKDIRMKMLKIKDSQQWRWRKGITYMKEK